MSQTNISRIERDKVSPSVATLNRLLEAMGETLQVTSIRSRRLLHEGGTSRSATCAPTLTG